MSVVIIVIIGSDTCGEKIIGTKFLYIKHGEIIGRISELFSNQENNERNFKQDIYSKLSSGHYSDTDAISCCTSNTHIEHSHNDYYDDFKVPYAETKPEKWIQPEVPKRHISKGKKLRSNHNGYGNMRKDTYANRRRR